MTTSQNYLSLYRKHSPLTQPDIAYLMRMQDHSIISRYEKGQREPNIEFILFYQYLFNTPVESFFEYQSNAVLVTLPQRIIDLIKVLGKKDNIPKYASKILFLEDVLRRLTTNTDNV